MSFCVECGAQGKVYGGLCGRCLVERNTFVRVPENLDMVECAHCQAILYKGTWHRTPRTQTIERALLDSVGVAPELQGHAVAYRETPEDEKNILLDIEATGRVGEVDVVEAHSTRVRLKTGVCDVCSRQRGNYFEGILQVRAAGRGLRPREVDRIKELVGLRTARGTTHGEFVAREEHLHGGLDFYLSSNSLARVLARSIQGELGGTVTVSPKLHTRREGKDLYRVTYLVRLPGYAVGDVVQVGGQLYQVVKMGATVATAALDDWSKRALKPAELEKARVVPREELQAILVSQGPGELQLMDPRTYETRSHTKPPGFEPEGDTVTVLKVEGTSYVAPLQGEEHRLKV